MQDWEGGGGGGNVLCPIHPRPLFQIRPGAETVVEFAREYQNPCPFPNRAPGFTLCNLIFGGALQSVYLVGELGEELSGYGVAGSGVVETEDSDVPEVGGGDVVGF